MAVIIGNIDWVGGHIRRGHFELTLEGKELEDFKSLTDKNKADFLINNGDIVIDDVRVDDWGKIDEIIVND